MSDEGVYRTAPATPGLLNIEEQSCLSNSSGYMESVNMWNKNVFTPVRDNVPDSSGATVINSHARTRQKRHLSLFAFSSY